MYTKSSRSGSCALNLIPTFGYKFCITENSCRSYWSYQNHKLKLKFILYILEAGSWAHLDPYKLPLHIPFNRPDKEEHFFPRLGREVDTVFKSVGEYNHLYVGIDSNSRGPWSSVFNNSEIPLMRSHTTDKTKFQLLSEEVETLLPRKVIE